MEKYKKYYRIVHDFHERWAPCPANSEEWNEATEDISRTANNYGNDLFLVDMLSAVFAELERSFKADHDKQP